MSDFLREMAASSAERAAVATAPPAAALDKPAVPLSLHGFDVIAEIKGRSPAEGQLADATLDRAPRARSYADGGACAISVLTEPSRFDGSLEHLAEVAAALPDTPVMRKDFLLEPVQIAEAKAHGASGVLLIVAMLDDGKLRSMLDCAAELGLFVLLESFDDNDLDRTRRLIRSADGDRIEAGQLLFGINTRNLRTLEVDPDRLARLAAKLPPGPAVAESGLHDAADAARVAALGYSLALVGTALMRADDPAALIAAMRESGCAELAA